MEDGREFGRSDGEKLSVMGLSVLRNSIKQYPVSLPMHRKQLTITADYAYLHGLGFCGGREVGRQRTEARLSPKRSELDVALPMHRKPLTINADYVDNTD
jgi:hypothetical protein